MRELSTAGPELRRGQSLLHPVYGGNYESFIEQRSILRQVYEHKFGPVGPPGTEMD